MSFIFPKMRQPWGGWEFLPYWFQCCGPFWFHVLSVGNHGLLKLAFCWRHHLWNSNQDLTIGSSTPLCGLLPEWNREYIFTRTSVESSRPVLSSAPLHSQWDVKHAREPSFLQTESGQEHISHKDSVGLNVIAYDTEQVIRSHLPIPYLRVSPLWAACTW